MSDNDAGGRFDPARYVRRLRGRGGPVDYLDVKWRLVWLRQDHADALIATELVTFSADLAIFKAVVTIPNGGSASGYGSETARDFTDYIEKAETKALGRALAALGYGTQFARDFEDDSLPGSRRDDLGAGAPPQRQASRRAPSTTDGGGRADTADASSDTVTPAPRRAAPVVNLRDTTDALERTKIPAAEESQESRPAIEPTRGPRHAPPGASAADAPPRALPVRQPTAIPAARPSLVRENPAGEEAKIDIANYGWTEFWNWARGAGFANRDMLDAAAGRSTQGMTPLEIRRLILEGSKGN